MITKLKYFFSEFKWMSVYNSPFKPPIPKLYIGKIAIGTPYFLPRVWKKATPQQAIDAALKEINRITNYNKQETKYKQTVHSFSNLYDRYINSSFSQTKKIGFDFVSLGWKTKWTNTDYRFEWSPMWSFVILKWQIAITFVAPEMHHYWECWLFYTYQTSKNKTVEQRIKQARKKFPCKWRIYRENGEEDMIDYWDVILKNKYKNHEIK